MKAVKISGKISVKKINDLIAKGFIVILTK